LTAGQKAKEQLDNGLPSDDLSGHTVIRMIIDVFAAPPTNGVVVEGSLGVALISKNYSDLLSTTVGPILTQPDEELDYMLLVPMIVHYYKEDATLGASGARFWHGHYDISAKRKYRPEDELTLFFNNDDTTHQWDEVHVGARTLIMLP